MTALASNNDLSARFADAPSDPVLAAHQLVAELAQIYYEKPNDTTARGVVALAPSGWPDNPAFVDALLGALASSPIIQPVTTASLFATLGPPASCRAGASSPPRPAAAGLPVRPSAPSASGSTGSSSAAPAARDR